MTIRQGGWVPKSSIRVSIDALLLERIDRLVRTGRFRRRSEFIQLAVEEKLARFRRDRLAAECAKLDPDEERAMAEEGLIDSIEPSFRYKNRDSV